MCVRGWGAPLVLLLARLFSRGGLEDISACTSSLENHVSSSRRACICHFGSASLSEGC